MKIAIIGGAGFIGTHVTQAYVNAGHDVLILDSLVYGAHYPIPSQARMYQVDMRAPQVEQILRNERPDVVSIHATQRRDAHSTEHTLTDADIHVRGLLNVLDSCVSASVKKVIFASGGNHLYGAVDDDLLPVSEDMLLNPDNGQDISKAAGEWYVRFYEQQYRLKYTILRYSSVYGETQPAPAYHPLSYFISSLQEHRRPVIRGTGDEKHDYIFIDDVVHANLQALKYADNTTLHISSGQGISLNHLYHLVASTLDTHLEPIRLSGPLGEGYSITLDNSTARRVLGWQPTVSLPEGIKQTIARIRRYSEYMEHATVAPRVPIAVEPTLTHA